MMVLININLKYILQLQLYLVQSLKFKNIFYGEKEAVELVNFFKFQV